ncbi:hypothetical protein M569_04107 [Genlisea aurea]|uniref:Pentatricopeptide repeat-containing protein n=1 Tax=Genlisea aurea TaxID=192259 RepID=S8CV27_9LAMI|nr:hypothetical protein M569_04107 [Genlisea aurea]
MVGRLWSSKERKCLSLLQSTFRSSATLLQIHGFMIVGALDANVNLVTQLIGTLSCTDTVWGTRHARRVFDHLPFRSDAFLCNTMMKSHLASGEFSEAVVLYASLRRNEAFVPDNYTCSTVAKCCALDRLTREGLGLHAHAIRYGFLSDVYAATALVDMYGKLGFMEFARNVFDEMTERSSVSWTSLMNGYVRCGDMRTAESYFGRMPEEEKDAAAFNVLIDGYVKLGDMESAKALFEAAPERSVVSWTTMIDGYCNGGDVEEARTLFDLMPSRNLYSWNAMIGGYCRNKQPHEAVALFRELLSQKRFDPDGVTVVSILPAIAELGAVDLGNRMFEFIKRNQLDRSSNVSTSAVDMFAKCGEISKARSVFDDLQTKVTCTWNALINGLAVNGRAEEALKAFSEMKTKGYRPDGTTMVGVLSACNHGGLVEEGKSLLGRMKEEFGIVPKIEHYGCVVDLMGRAGRLEEAEELIRSMPYEANGIILSSLVSACACWDDVGRAERIARRAIEMEPCNDGNYVMMRNLYAGDGRWRDAERIKRLMAERGAKKETGFSAIEEIDKKVLQF